MGKAKSSAEANVFVEPEEEPEAAKPEKINLLDGLSLKKALDDAVIQVGPALAAAGDEVRLVPGRPPTAGPPATPAGRDGCRVQDRLHLRRPEDRPGPALVRRPPLPPQPPAAAAFPFRRSLHIRLECYLVCSLCSCGLACLAQFFPKKHRYNAWVLAACVAAYLVLSTLMTGGWVPQGGRGGGGGVKRWREGGSVYPRMQVGEGRHCILFAAHAAPATPWLSTTGAPSLAASPPSPLTTRPPPPRAQWWPWCMSRTR